MLNLIKALITALEENEIGYCHWKNNHALAKSLNGEDDLDFLVRFNQRHQFVHIIAEFGFREAENRHMAYRHIHHFYGLDTAIGRIVHLHVYFKLITGESHIKNYHLALEETVFNNLQVSPLGVKVPTGWVQLALFLIRYYIKISCLPGLLLIIRNKNYVNAEYRYITAQLDSPLVIPLIGRHIDLLSEKTFENLYRNYGKPSFRALRLGLSLRRQLNACSRYTGMEGFVHRYGQIGYRFLNKMIFRQKKVFTETGMLMAITGLDATGKSTVVKALTSFFSQDFNCKRIHVGIPPTTWLTFPVRILLSIRKWFKKKGLNKTESLSPPPVTILLAIRYAGLAYERYLLISYANRLRLKGHVVICDRFPSLNLGKMDSPRIGVSKDDSQPIRLLGKIELALYKKCAIPNIIFDLRISIDQALERNRRRNKKGKETEQELRHRYKANSELTYKAETVFQINAAKSLDTVLKDIKTIIWNNL